MYSDQLYKTLQQYGPSDNPLKQTYSFVKEFLRPQESPYWRYRYEHSLRVALWGKRIAENEGWFAEPLIIACLLHDIGYPECHTDEDFDHHAIVSAEVSGLFLKQIQYDETYIPRMLNAISIHDRWNDIPEDAEMFALSVRDADDLDRFDTMRLYIAGSKAIGENHAERIIDICINKLNTIEEWKNRICGSPTAENFWQEILSKQTDYYKKLLTQMQDTIAIEQWLNC